MLVDQAGACLRALVVVADGMGGHNAGEVASAITVAACRESFERLNSSFTREFSAHDARNFLQSLLHSVNQRILLQASADPACAGMGTTAVIAAVLPNDQAVVGHVGDSRAYLLRAGGITQLTRDHSALAERMRDAPEEIAASLEDLRSDPYAHALTRSLGQEEHVEPDITAPFDLLPGDTLLLVSDGLTDVLESHVVLHVHENSRGLEPLCRELIEAALTRGSDDNITVAALAVGADHRLMARPRRSATQRSRVAARVERNATSESAIRATVAALASSRGFLLRAALALGLVAIGLGLGLWVGRGAGGNSPNSSVSQPKPTPLPETASGEKAKLPSPGTGTPAPRRPDGDVRPGSETATSRKPGDSKPKSTDQTAAIQAKDPPRPPSTESRPSPTPPPAVESGRSGESTPPPPVQAEVLPIRTVPPQISDSDVVGAGETGDEGSAGGLTESPTPSLPPAIAEGGGSLRIPDPGVKWSRRDGWPRQGDASPPPPEKPRQTGRSSGAAASRSDAAGPSRLDKDMRLGKDSKDSRWRLSGNDDPVFKVLGYTYEGRTWRFAIGCNCRVDEVTVKVANNTEEHRVTAAERAEWGRWDGTENVQLTGYEVIVPFTLVDERTPKGRQIRVRFEFGGRQYDLKAKKGLP